MMKFIARGTLAAAWIAGIAGIAWFFLHSRFGFDALSQPHWRALGVAWDRGWRVATPGAWAFVALLAAPALLAPIAFFLAFATSGPADAWKRWRWRRAAESGSMVRRVPTPAAAKPEKRKPAPRPPAGANPPIAASGRPAGQPATTPTRPAPEAPGSGAPAEPDVEVPTAPEAAPAAAAETSRPASMPEPGFAALRMCFSAAGYKVISHFNVDEHPRGRVDLVAVGDTDIYLVVVHEADGEWNAHEDPRDRTESCWIRTDGSGETDSPIVRAADLRARLDERHGAHLEALGIGTVHTVVVLLGAAVTDVQNKIERWVSDFDVHVVRHGATVRDDVPDIGEFLVDAAGQPGPDVVPYLINSSKIAVRASA